MIVILLALISATTAVQGDVVNLTLDQPAEVVMDDCMYIEETLTSHENLSAGDYGIKITHSCLGTYYISVKEKGGREQQIALKVEEDPNPRESLKSLDAEIMNLKKEISGLDNKLSYYKSLVETLNSINMELYDRIKGYVGENKRLESELAKYKMLSENCTRVVTSLESLMKSKNETIAHLEQENAKLEGKVKNLTRNLTVMESYTDLFRTMFTVTLAFLVGALFAIFRR
ncbi:hypothetical protein [Archaeoglobus neptunius]|uniref:hypothetical protein n=1 Tax=Archaeoglobus neptunius TaxID=2798580 RepID=UPI0019257901|nr:hypothetical protein [Archaeoglobus neptunius]